MTAPQPPEVPALLHTRGLELASGYHVTDLDIHPGLTLIHASRETSATALALTLAGRMRPANGEVWLEDGDGVETTTQRERFRRVALAGVTAIDSLERLVSVRAVLREQYAWSSPWWQFTPRSIENPPIAQGLDKVGLDFSTETAAHTAVGELDVLRRFKLRVALSFIARPEAELLIVDDIDQLRSMRLRREFLRCLKDISVDTPVIAISANADSDGICDDVIRLTGNFAQEVRA